MWSLSGLVEKDRTGNVLNAKELHVCRTAPKVKRSWDTHRNSLEQTLSGQNTSNCYKIVTGPKTYWEVFNPADKRKLILKIRKTVHIWYLK